ncbi:MAG: hypothetical protein U1F49_06565 [Rubrivivax sp.]
MRPNSPRHRHRHPTSGRRFFGGLSPQAFMRRYWQRRPLLVRQAWPGAAPPLLRPRLFALAASDGVESRLVERTGRGHADCVRYGLMPRAAAASQPRWTTLLVQGMDLHERGARDAGAVSLPARGAAR